MPEATRVRFPIMAWNWVKGDAAKLGRMRENGLTVAGFAAPADLDAVHAAGLQAIVSDPRVNNYDWRQVDPAQARRNVAELVAAVGKHPAVLGYYLKDEPHAEEFAGLAVVAAEVRAQAPGKWPYINLFPDYASPQQLGTASYAEHLERFVTACQPPVISYDNYSLLEHDELRPQYWTNLEAVSAIARRQGVPFWNIVLTVAHFNYRELSAADARFQVFTTLAYGGRGLSYFTYFAPACGNYRMAPVDQFGAETPTWYHLQHVNRQVAQWAPTLLALRHDDAYHFGHVPAGAHAPPPAALVRGLEGREFLVGEFTHADGARYVMIVNKRFHDSQWCHPVFCPTPAAVAVISPYTGEALPYTGEQCVLAPGQGVLLRLGRG